MRLGKYIDALGRPGLQRYVEFFQLLRDYCYHRDMYLWTWDNAYCGDPEKHKRYAKAVWVVLEEDYPKELELFRVTK